MESLDAGGHVCCRDAAKDALLKPATILQLIAAAPAAAAPAEAPPKPDGGQLFSCKGCSCSARCYDYATRVSGTPCPVCKHKMTTEVHLVEPDGSAAVAADARSRSSSGYVRDMVTYTVMDALSVVPISTISAVTALVSLGVIDISGLQAKNVEIRYKVKHMTCHYGIESHEPLNVLCTSKPKGNILVAVKLLAKPKQKDKKKLRITQGAEEDDGNDQDPSK